MNLQDINRLLTFAKAVDNRKVDDATVRTWQAILADVDPTDASEAARRHFRDSGEYLTPAHIVEGAAQVAGERAFAARREWLDRIWADDPEYDRPGRPALPAVHTEDRADEVKALITSVVANLPQMDIHARAQARARKERGRPVPPPPARARKRQDKPPKWPEPADDRVQRLATQMLIDGYDPADVSERLYVSRRWCEHTAAKFTGATP